MERIIKYFFVIICLLYCSALSYAETAVPVKVEQKIELSQCVKTFPIAYDKLYYLTLAAANEYNYNLKEIQTRGGYIVFETGNRKYLASVIYVSSAKSMLKITPYSGDYNFSVEIPQNIFKYIELYQNNKF